MENNITCISNNQENKLCEIVIFKKTCPYNIVELTNKRINLEDGSRV